MIVKPYKNQKVLFDHRYWFFGLVEKDILLFAFPNLKKMENDKSIKKFDDLVDKFRKFDNYSNLLRNYWKL